MSTSPITLAQAGTWEDRVGTTDWDAVRADGSMGGYRGGPEAKRALLTLEEAAA